MKDANFMSTTVNADQLYAVLIYAYMQADGSDINPLAWGWKECAESKLDANDPADKQQIIDAIGLLLEAVKAASDCDGLADITLVATKGRQYFAAID